MKNAGITIRRLSLLRDALQDERNRLTDSIDREIAIAEANRPTGTVATRSDYEQVMRAERSRIDTALERIKPALIGLTEIYSSGWFDMPLSTFVASIKRGKPQ